MNHDQVVSLWAVTNYDGDDSGIVLETPGNTWNFDPRLFLKAVGMLNCFASGNPCDFPSAELRLGRGGETKVVVSPATMYSGMDNRSVEFSLRDFANMPQAVLDNPTMGGVREYAKSLHG